MPVPPPVANLSRVGGNRLLSGLSTDDLRRLQTSLERVRVARGQILSMPGQPLRHVYFPLRGVIALVAMTSDGEMLQVASVGPEGVVGVPTVLHEDVLPYQVVVPVAGEAIRIPVATLLHELQRAPAFQQALLAYAHQQVTSMAQAAVCQRFHTVLQRLALWLLTAADGVGADTLDITQELIARLLGAPRSAVSWAATQLQDRGIVRLRHGRVQILKRVRLQTTSCTCYVQPRA
jgi:CRP-like cAMP-binding protein